MHAAGLVIRDLPVRASNFRAQHDLSSYLQQQGIVGIADIDTRTLTRRLRQEGAQAGCIVAANGGSRWRKAPFSMRCSARVRTWAWPAKI